MKRLVGVLLLLCAAAQSCWVVYDISVNGFEGWIHLAEYGSCFALLTIGLMCKRGQKRRPDWRSELKGGFENLPDKVYTPLLTDAFPFRDMGKLSGAGCVLLLITLASGFAFLILGAFFVSLKDFEWNILLAAGAVAFGTFVYLIGKGVLWSCGLAVRRRDRRVLWATKVIRRSTAGASETEGPEVTFQEEQSRKKNGDACQMKV
jgi:hypothetical protein